MIELTNKIVLITGASRGIGRATALLLGKAGAQVAVNYRSSEAEADEVVRAIGDRAFAVQADVANPDEVAAMIDAVLDRCGRIDILVNNAALYHEDNPFEGEDYEWWQRSWRQTFETNLFGAANAAFLAMRSMRKNGGGKIINVSSRAAWRGEIEFADYGASKAGLVNLTRSIARACAKDNIVASCVTPGFVDTGQPHLREHYDEIVAQIPLRRVASVDDVASAILFLASPMADYLNGVAIDINGGSWFQ